MKINFIPALFIALATLLISFNSEKPKGYAVGDKASDFKLTNIDNKTVSLADYKNAKGFIVVFSCNHCPFVVAYEDRIVALDKKYKDKGYPVIAINSNDAVQYPADSFDKMKERAKAKQFTFPYLHDPSQQTATIYGATKTPHIYVLQKSGKDLIVKYIGAIDDNSEDANAVTEKYAENALNQLLAGEEVKVPTTKAIGCTIKWKK
jgi:peroxiredoxin